MTDNRGGKLDFTQGQKEWIWYLVENQQDTNVQHLFSSAEISSTGSAPATSSLPQISMAGNLGKSLFVC